MKRSDGLGYFFFKHEPAYEERISDGSSDLCSSDLPRMSEIGEMPLGIAVAIPVPRCAVAVRSGTSEPRRKSLRVDHFQSSLYARSPEPGQEARSLQAEPGPARG